jgi:hypothetical protein
MTKNRFRYTKSTVRHQKVQARPPHPLKLGILSESPLRRIPTPVKLCALCLIFGQEFPQKTSEFDHQNLRKPQQNPTSSTLVNREILWAPSPPVLRSFSGGGSRPATRTLPAMGNSGGASKLREASRTAAVSRSARDQPQRVGLPSRVECFRGGYSCEAAAAGLRHSRGPRPASAAPRRFRAGNGPQKLAARACGRKRRRRCALPAQSMTRPGLPGASEWRGASTAGQGTGPELPLSFCRGSF